MSQQIDFDPNIDFYKALGVAQSATADEIKKQYRKLAKQYHPDSTGGDKAKEQRFKEISNAYDVLGDAKKKQLYDDIRSGAFQGPRGGQQRGPGGVTYTYETSGGPGVFDLGDLFGQFFQQGQAPGGKKRSRSVDMNDFEEAFRQQQGGRRAPQQAEDAEFTSKVKASDGTWLDVKGTDVYSDVRVSFDRAILGTVVSVPTMEGKSDVKIPPGTSSGKKLRLRGKGISDRSGAAGHHYVTVQIDVPSGELDDESKKLLVQLVQRVRKRGQND
ncbi:MAG: DnaJ domain-containing protein [Kofleriaceae bacterium]